jgi:hypothetical protein
MNTDMPLSRSHSPSAALERGGGGGGRLEERAPNDNPAANSRDLLATGGPKEKWNPANR